MYDGASATAEAALMALRVTRRSRWSCRAGLHPHYAPGARHLPRRARREIGGRCPERLERPRQRPDDAHRRRDRLPARPAARLPRLNRRGSEAGPPRPRTPRGALLVVVRQRGAVPRPAAPARATCGADIVCGEAQSFGVPMGVRRAPPRLPGGAQPSHVRQMPGRLVGQTVDANGKRGFVLTLSTREQHIRRERSRPRTSAPTRGSVC